MMIRWYDDPYDGTFWLPCECVRWHGGGSVNDKRRLRVRKLEVGEGDHHYRWRVSTTGNLIRWYAGGWLMHQGDGVWGLFCSRHVCYALPGETYIRVGRQH